MHTVEPGSYFIPELDVYKRQLRMFHHDNHLLQGIIRQLHHEMDMLVLLLGEILIGLALAVDGKMCIRDR